MNYTHLKDWEIQKDYIDKLSDSEKVTLYDNLGNYYPELEENDVDFEEKINWISTELETYHYENPSEDVTFVCTITFKDDVSKELFDYLEEDGICLSVDFESKEVKYLPDFEPMYIPKEANLCGFCMNHEIDLSLVEYFEIGDG